jgi:branched-chain amino acid transport system permease protein
MPALGISVRRVQVRVFTLGAGIAGVAGALLTQTTQFVGLDVLGFQRSAELLIMLVLGGTGRLYGAIIGTAIFMAAQAYLSMLSPVYWQFWLGLFLVMIVLAARGGIMGGLSALRARLGRRRE